MMRSAAQASISHTRSASACFSTSSSSATLSSVIVISVSGCRLRNPDLLRRSTVPASGTAARALCYANGSARGLLLHHHRGHSPDAVYLSHRRSHPTMIQHPLPWHIDAARGLHPIGYATPCPRVGNLRRTPLRCGRAWRGGTGCLRQWRALQGRLRRVRARGRLCRGGGVPCRPPGGQLSIFSAEMNACWGISTLPNWRIFFLPAFCFSRSFFFRVTSPP